MSTIKAKELKEGNKYMTDAGMVVEAGSIITDKNHQKFGYREIHVLEGEKKGKKLAAPPEMEFQKYVATKGKKAKDVEEIEDIEEAPKGKKSGKNSKHEAPAKGKKTTAKAKAKADRGPSKREVILRLLRKGGKTGVTAEEIKDAVGEECETIMKPEKLRQNVILTISALKQEGYEITREEVSKYYLTGEPKESKGK